MAEEVKKETTEAPKGTGATGLAPNVAAVLAYLFGWVGGLVLFLIEKENKFVRFAAMQSIILNVAVIALWLVLGFLTTILTIATMGIGALFAFLYPVLWIGFVIVWVMLMVKAYNNQEWELPVIGKIARNVINK